MTTQDPISSEYYAPKEGLQTVELSWEADWVQRNTGLTLTADAARCVDTLSAIQRPYNWSLIGSWSDAIMAPEPLLDYDGEHAAAVRPPVVIGNKWIVARLRNSLSTFDFGDLTALVLAAHRNAVRVEVSAETFLAVDRESYLSEFVLGEDGEGGWTETDEHPSCASSCLRVQLNARGREGSVYERHPTIEDVLAAHDAAVQP